MERPVAVIVGGFASILVASYIVYAPAAGAAPECPFFSHEAYAAAVRKNVDEVRARDLYGKNLDTVSPEDRAAMERIDRESREWTAACYPPGGTTIAPRLGLPDAVPAFDPEPLEPGPKPPLIVDSIDNSATAPGPATSPVDCTKLREAYSALGPVVTVGDAVAKLNKVPGFSQVQGASLLLCGLDAVPAALGNPSPENQQRIYEGLCGGIAYFTNGIFDGCGDTPVR